MQREHTIDQILTAFSQEIASMVEDVDTTTIEEWGQESAEYQLADVQGIVGRLEAALGDSHKEYIRLHCFEAATALMKVAYTYGEL